MLQSARLRLIPFENSDLVRLHALWTDPDVRRYLWDDETRLDGEWRFETFRASHLQAYVEMCQAFREDVRDNDLPPEEEEK